MRNWRDDALSCALMPSAGGARWLADSPSRGEKAGPQHSCEICQARLPDEMPRGPFDLIVVSDIAYYLSVHELALLGKRLVPLLRLAVKLSCFTTADTFKMLRNCPVSRTFDCDLS